MRISDLFGGNVHLSVVQILCAKQGITMPECEAKQIETMQQSNQSFFVFIDKSGLAILQMRERSELLGKIVSGHLRRGVVLFFHDCTYREVTRGNWKDTWRMIVPKKQIQYDDRIPVPKREHTSFDDALPDRPHKKFSRKGFLCTMIANESMQRISKPII